jgi:hypothetical protein
MPKKFNPIRNLKGFAHARGAKLPSGAKIGKGTKYGKPTIAKPTRKRIRKMQTPKGI